MHRRVLTGTGTSRFLSILVAWFLGSTGAACGVDKPGQRGGTGSGGSSGSSGGAGPDAAFIDAGPDIVPAQPDTAIDFTGPDFMTMMASGTAVGVPGQQLLITTGPVLNTYRTYVRPRAPSRWRWAFWMTNGTDSTYGNGAPRPNLLGGPWTILAASVGDGGTTPSGNVVAGTSTPVTFSGERTKDVQPGERFWSDPVPIDLPPGHLLVFTWAISAPGVGPSIPFASVPFLTSFRAMGVNIADQEAAAGFSAATDPIVAPQLFAWDHPTTNRFCFLGDSITQGIGSNRDTYGYWVAKIADGLAPEISVWNLGSGWARAADAASDGYWLYKAKQCTEVAVILGVNDINSGRTADQILTDLTTILTRLKDHDPTVKTTLFTVPTFNLTGAAYTTWKQVNDTIRTQPPSAADRVFDMAAVQSQPAPRDAFLKPGYSNGDGHPNDMASTEVANAFLAWYR